MDHLVGIDGLGHLNRAETAVVKRLTARCRIERVTVERRGGPALMVETARDDSTQRAAVGIDVVEAIGHIKSQGTRLKSQVTSHKSQTGNTKHTTHDTQINFANFENI